MQPIIITKKNIDALPKTAGVYLFYQGNPSARSGRGNLVYIGKAINIRDRVKNHFNQPSYRDNLFIKKVTTISFIETDSEIDALVLEAQLIKKNLPKFNVVWRDDKNYFYIAIEKNKYRLPYVYVTHQRKDPKAHYIGPFVEGNALKKTLKYLRRAFPFYTTSRHPATKCTWCHLGLCPGPNPDVAEYKKNIKKLTLVLQGKRTRVGSSLRKEMESLSRAQKFEDAQKIRDQIMALERVFQHTHVIENQHSAVGDWQLAEQKLKKIISVDKVSKIECYDISNIQGKNAVGSMVVFVNGAPDKSQYKKFRIRMENEPNDIAMLKEVITRRLAHPEWEYPEVMLIDGGIAQLNVAIKTLRLRSGQAKKIKVISIAKGRQELFIEGKKEPIPLKNLPQEIYNLIKHLDDEAHRFAITYHRRTHSKSILKS